MRKSVLVLPVLLGGCIVAMAFPDGDLPPTYGTISHSPAQSQFVSVSAGGTIAASVVISSCNGYVAGAPDVSINNSTIAGIIPLDITASASGDTTLLVRTPDGRWLCDDDSGGGLNPAIRINNPVNGQYDVWVGTYAAGSYISATLRVF